jgi:4-amino-4-deoxy-L-arabinose transferase-like glycosyltransferase
MEADRPASLSIWRLLGLALCLRILLPVSGYLYTRDPTIFYAGDTMQYVVPATQLIAHHKFFSDGSIEARVWNSPVAPAPEIIRTPGYPALLATGLLVRRLVPTTIAVQILLSCFTVYVVYRIADLLFERKWTALIAAALYAIEPAAVLFSSLLSTETLFTAILTLGVYYLVRYLRRESLSDLLIAAGALAASAYVRPVGYYLPLTIVLGLGAWMLVGAYRKKARLLVYLVGFLIASNVLTGVWRIRNEILTGYSGFSSVFSDDMYCNMAASVLAAKRHISYGVMQQRLGCYDLSIYFMDHPKQRAQPIGQIVKYERKNAILLFLRNPVTFARIYLEGVARGIFDPLSTEFVRFFDLYPKEGGLLDTAINDGVIKTLEVLFSNRLLAWSTIVLFTLHLLYITGLCESLFKAPPSDPAFFIVLLIMSYYLLLPGGPSDWGRYRHPAMPLICVLASYGLRSLWSELNSRTRTRRERVLNLELAVQPEAAAK